MAKWKRSSRDSRRARARIERKKQQIWIQGKAIRLVLTDLAQLSQYLSMTVAP
jgi:hypothetical protein